MRLPAAVFGAVNTLPRQSQVRVIVAAPAVRSTSCQRNAKSRLGAVEQQRLEHPDDAVHKLDRFEEFAEP